MVSALYYPHTYIRSERILKNALLLWDSVDCIVPWNDWRPEHAGRDRPTPRVLREAEELVVHYRVPTRMEQRQAHKEILTFLRSGFHERIDDVRHRLELGEQLPEWRYTIGLEYLIYPGKFLPETWRALQQEKLAAWDEPTLDYGVPAGLGLLMMSLLADACAGSMKQKVTDRVEAYSWVEARKAQVLGASPVSSSEKGDVSPDQDRLVTLSLEVLDAGSIPLKRLLALRKREALSSSSGDYRALRLRYLERLRSYVDRISTEAHTVGDVQEIERQFKLDMEDDLQQLRRELNLTGVKALLSKEVALSVIAVAGALSAPIAGIGGLALSLKGIGVAPLVKTLAEYRAARRRALRDHAMSWLYLSQGGLAIR